MYPLASLVEAIVTPLGGALEGQFRNDSGSIPAKLPGERSIW